ncbi:FIBCD1 [Branchiostoma lanceolatum]|uniref:FIBCD1 protein n=1 Tax=Branchiostoma lanceolatum TaxID=7740 RepID=A0A8K0ECH5_BRALA|nr:FIBCD1 [Branchiostoma lanceolatum]
MAKLGLGLAFAVAFAIFLVDSSEPSSDLISPKNCADLYLLGVHESGPYYVGYPGPFLVYCDMDTNGGGWTIIQRRQDGSVPFDKPWDEYVHGFGNVSGEFWLGLDRLHRLTTHQDHELYVSLEDWDGESAFAKYGEFSVGEADSKYTATISGYSGNATDSLTPSSKDNMNNEKFTTWDQDNDNNGNNCAAVFGQGGWWYPESCDYAMLNGQYLTGCDSNCESAQGIVWETWKGYRYSLKKTAMMIRPTSFPRCPHEDYVRFKGVCYKYFAEPKTYDDARQTCAADGGMLAMPKDNAINTFIAGLGNGEKCWIGLTDADREGQWVFADGQTLESTGYYNWAPDQPKNSNEQDCAVLMSGSTWGDAGCNVDRKFNCQIDQECPKPGYVRFNGICYKDFADDEDKKTYDEARQTCAADGGMLAMPKDGETNTFIAELGNGNDQRWIGLTDADSEDQWVFEDGQTLQSTGYSNWKDNEPTDDDDKHCAVLRPNDSTWEDKGCSDSKRFICQLFQGTCQHGGTVTTDGSDTGRYSCLCTAGWRGTYCEQACLQPLGMESGAIPDDRITASSYWGPDHEPYRGRLNGAAGEGAWVVGKTNKTVGQWLQVFEGNRDGDTSVTNLLEHPFDARYVRFYPQTWNDQISMRAEVLGCNTETSCTDTKSFYNERWWYNYTLDSENLFPPPVNQPVVFEARAKDAVHISLSAENRYIGLGHQYEIRIGIATNTKSSISPPGWNPVHTPGILSPNNFRRFWICWTKRDKLYIAVGRDGEGKPFVSTIDRNPKDINYVGYGTSDPNGQFRFKCEQDFTVCPEPPTVNHTADSGPDCICPYWTGKRCTYQCIPGYHAAGGDVTRTCGGDGQWTGTLQCHDTWHIRADNYGVISVNRCTIESTTHNNNSNSNTTSRYLRSDNHQQVVTRSDVINTLGKHPRSRMGTNRYQFNHRTSQ